MDDFEHSDLVRQINELFLTSRRLRAHQKHPTFSAIQHFQPRVRRSVHRPAAVQAHPERPQHARRLGRLAGYTPFSLLISWVFFTIEQIGEFSKNPFDNSVNDTPSAPFAAILRLISKKCWAKKSCQRRRFQPEKQYYAVNAFLNHHQRAIMKNIEQIFKDNEL